MIVNFLWGLAPPAPAPPSPVEKTITPVVHLVYGLWEDGRLPLRYRPMLGSWLRHHRGSGWRVVLWDRGRADELVRTRFPELAELYAGFARRVQRADLLRYLLLYEFGGFYADLDILCVGNLNGMLSECVGASLVVQVETVLTSERAAEIGSSQPIRTGRPEIEERIANYFMGCRPRHPVMGEVIELARERGRLQVKNDYDVIYTTGPDVVSEVIHRHKQLPDLAVLPRARAEEYVRHFCWGSWRES